MALRLLLASLRSVSISARRYFVSDHLRVGPAGMVWGGQRRRGDVKRIRGDCSGLLEQFAPSFHSLRARVTVTQAGTDMAKNQRARPTGRHALLDTRSRTFALRRRSFLTRFWWKSLSGGKLNVYVGRYREMGERA